MKTIIRKIKQRRSLQRRVQIEVLETLATITMYLIHDRHSSNPCVQYLPLHFECLKKLSSELRKEEFSNGRSN